MSFRSAPPEGDLEARKRCARDNGNAREDAASIPRRSRAMHVRASKAHGDSHRRRKLALLRQETALRVQAATHTRSSWGSSAHAAEE